MEKTSPKMTGTRYCVLPQNYVVLCFTQIAQYLFFTHYIHYVPIFLSSIPRILNFKQRHLIHQKVIVFARQLCLFS